MRRRDATGFFHDYAGDFAAIYSGGHSAWSRLINRRFRRSMLLRFQHSLKACEPVAGKSILDVGCGPGHYGVALAKAGASRVVGLDSAPSMIELAHLAAQRQGVSKQCEFVQVPWADYRSEQKFDHVICMGFLEYLDTPAPAVAKAIACTSVSAVFSLPDREGFLAWQRRLRYRFKTPLYMYSREEVAALFGGIPEVAHFTVERLERDYFVTALPEVAATGNLVP